MRPDKYNPHVFVLPEDDANRQIANSFVLHPNLRELVIQVLPPAGGWGKVLKKFSEEHLSGMRQYPERRIILVIDFDQREERLSYVNSQIPDDLKERVFVLGVFSNPEKLKSDIRKSFEGIGEALTNDCSDDKNELWGHDLLKHNKIELDRMLYSVKPFLFN